MNHQIMEIEHVIARAASYYIYHLTNAVMRRYYRGPNNTLLSGVFGPGSSLDDFVLLQAT
jgi:hypothetical protein